MLALKLDNFLVVSSNLRRDRRNLFLSFVVSGKKIRKKSPFWKLKSEIWKCFFFLRKKNEIWINFCFKLMVVLFKYNNRIAYWVDKGYSLHTLVTLRNQTLSVDGQQINVVDYSVTLIRIVYDMCFLVTLRTAISRENCIANESRELPQPIKFVHERKTS